MFQQSSVLARLHPPTTAVFGPLRVLALIPIVVGELAWGIRDASRDVDAMEAVVRSAQAPFSWSDRSPTFTLVIALSLVGLVMTRFVCAGSMDRRPRLAWGLIWGLAAIMTWANLVSRADITGGYADATGVVWLRRDEVIDRRPWSHATSLAVGCMHLEGRRSGGLHDRVLYSVKVGGRSARLGGRQVGWGRPSVSRWLTQVGAVDRALPAGVVVSRYGLDARCLRYYGRHLYEPELRGFIRLLRPTPQQAAALAEKDKPVGVTVAEVAAER